MSQPFVTVGRSVHYQAYGTPGGEHPSVPRAAMITATKNEEPKLSSEQHVCLTVFNPTGFFFNSDVPYSEEPKPGHWSWPKKV